jgi:serine protease
MLLRRLCLFLVPFVAASVDAGERATRLCNPGFFTGEVFIQASEAGRQRILDVVANPALDPDLYERLWRPSSAQIYTWRLDPPDVVIGFQPVQDTSEIARGVPSDARLRAMGVSGAWANSYDVCGVPPPPVRVRVTEFHNSVTDHYFLSSSEAENAAIESGAAGPGWARTGEGFDAIKQQACTSSRPVFRFYTYDANSHFFTPSTEECGFLRNNDPGWLFEGEAFGGQTPVNGTCPSLTKPVYRLYNNRWQANDSNHRFVTRLDLYEQMKARGWIGEGIGICVDDYYTREAR